MKKYNRRAPCLCRGQCFLLNCIHKLCKEPYAKIVERVTIGHGTHDGTFSGTVYLSETDLNGENRLQYAKMYEDPVPNPDTSGQNVDPKLTAELTNNPEMQSNLHIKASRNPLQPSNHGSDDINNIN